MEYRVMTVANAWTCCSDPLEDVHGAIQEECNKQARDGFVLVTAFDTRSQVCSCCASHVCWRKTACLVFARP